MATKPPDTTYHDTFSVHAYAEQELTKARLTVAARAESNEDCKYLLDVLGLL